MSRKKSKHAPATGGNPEYVQAMQGLRRSSATTPVPSGRRYRRWRRQDQAKDRDND